MTVDPLAWANDPTPQPNPTSRPRPRPTPELLAVAGQAVHSRLHALAADRLDAGVPDLDQDQWHTWDAAAAQALKDLFAPAAAPPRLYYRSVDEFVREFLCPLWRRDVGPAQGLRWSARWWESVEAVTRLEALWRAWEALRLDPALGMSVWLKDHADHHMAVLMAPKGPFRTSADTATCAEPLPYIPPPPGLFDGSGNG